MMASQAHFRTDASKATVRDEVHDATMMIMPWAVSALLHAGVVLLSVFLVWSTTDPTTQSDDQIIIPRISDHRERGQLLLDGVGGDSGARVSTSLHLAAAPGGTAIAIGPADARRVGMAPGSGRDGGAAAGRQGASAQGDGRTGWAGPLSSGGGAGNRGGKGSPFDGASTTGVPGTGVFPIPPTISNARSFVFLIDASGSLIDTLPFVILELNRFIGQLQEKHSFNVIFFQGDVPIEVNVPRPGLKRGTIDNKAAVIEWINPRAGHVVPQGKSNPLPALKLALSQNPDVLFILSDNITGQGVYQIDQRRLLDEIESRATGKTKISTVQFLYPDPLSKVGMKPTLQLIAERFGGEYRFIDGRELGIE